MKTLFTVLGCFALLATVAAAAEGNSTLRANVPFEFVVADVTMPAGDYVVQRTTMPNVLRIQTSDGQKAINVIVQTTRTADPHPTPGLVFHRYGGTYFFSEVQTVERGLGARIPTCKSEREMLARIPAAGPVTVAAAR